MSVRRILLALVLCFVLFITFFILILSQPPLSKGGPAGGGISPKPPTVTPTAELVILQSAPVFESTPTPLVLPPTPTPVPEGPVFYTVQPGETLAQIAERFDIDLYGLARANYLSDINRINAGQQLLIASIPITIPEATVLEGKQIIVVLSTQRAYAYENGVLQKEFIVATGVAAHPTVTGNYAIYIKLEKTDMSDGITYDIKDVPWTMYFYQGYGLHGAPWNNNLGTPGSHGCVNMSVEDADWLFHWASVGTPVLVLP